jgi:hypothetical protein
MASPFEFNRGCRKICSSASKPSQSSAKVEQHNQRLIVVFQYIGVIMHAKDVSIKAYEQVFLNTSPNGLTAEPRPKLG